MVNRLSLAWEKFFGIFYPPANNSVARRRTLPITLTRSALRRWWCRVSAMILWAVNCSPADKCVEFYASLLRAGVKAELHIFGKGSHGFDLGVGRGNSAALWPASFAAWLRDSNLIQESDAMKKIKGE